jgi:hypothetical protein
MARKITRQMPDVTSVECCPSVTLGDEALLQGGKLGGICFQRCPGGRDSEDLRLCPAGTRIGSCRLVTFGFLAVVRGRDALVSIRVQLINAVRGLVKSMATAASQPSQGSTIPILEFNTLWKADSDFLEVIEI